MSRARDVANRDIVDGAVTSAKILDGAIVDDDVSPSAAIGQSKVQGLTTALSEKAALASPTFTGSPKAPTASVGTNTTQIATTAFVNSEIANDAVSKSLVTSKGDMLVATASSVVTRLAVGANNQVLVADSSQSSGVKWAAPSSGALVYVGGTSFSNTGTVNVDGVFSSSYRNYRLIISGSFLSGNAYATIRMRTSGGSNETSSSHRVTIMGAAPPTSSTVYTVSSGADGFLSGFIIGNVSPSNLLGYAMSFDILDPFLSGNTKMLGHMVGSQTGVFVSSILHTMTSYTGFSMTGTGWPYTGEVRVYGYKDSS